MPIGHWKIQLIDEELHVLTNTFETDMRNGITSLPVAGGFITGGSSQLYHMDCTPISKTDYGTLVTSSTGPGNMTFTNFNGIDSSLTLANDPSLSFTGDMSISIWLKPYATGTSTDSSNWHQIIGKGSISGGTENDNYQLFQIGDKLVFEWNDASSGKHYQAITTTAPVSSANWNYVTTSISGGTIEIYTNGVSQNLVYSEGLDPRSISTPVPNPPIVNLKNNDNNVTVGMQNGESASQNFNYKGDIGALSLYNRGLTTTEIQQNYQAYRT
jgi:hypothetical protein